MRHYDIAALCLNLVNCGIHSTLQNVLAAKIAAALNHLTVSVCVFLTLFVSVSNSRGFVVYPCLPLYLSIYQSIYLSTYLSVCLSVGMSVYLSTYLSMSSCLSVCLSQSLSLCISVSFSLALSVNVHLSLSAFIYHTKHIYSILKAYQFFTKKPYFNFN